MQVLLTAAAFAIALGGTAAAQTGAPPPGAGAPPMKFEQACGGDVQQFCPTAQSKKDRKQCLKQNKARLSQTCHAFFEEKKEMRQGKKQEQQAAPAQGQPGQTPPPH